MARPKLAVWKFASCDGCQLTLLDCEDELLEIAGALDIAQFLEATKVATEGPYDISLVEGSITTAHDAERIRDIRAQSKALITIGACATAGGIQSLRNFADVKEYTRLVYAHPDYISTLATSTPISDHVTVDFELRGCPVSKHQLLELISATLAGRKPKVARELAMHGMQAAGHGLRDGRAGHSLPWSGHAGRLRQSLPGGWARLLRLLRAEGNAERSGAIGADGRPWPHTARPARPLPKLQRGRARFPRRKRTP